MKFGKKCKALFANIDCGLPPLPYKRLKKNMKIMSSSEFFDDFATIVDEVDAVWLKAIRDLKCFCIYRFESRPNRVYALLAYAQLCREGVRKLLKKYNKKHPGHCWTMNRRLYFVQSNSLQRLKDVTSRYPMTTPHCFKECPVCLHSHAQMTELVCGHAVCIDCHTRLSQNAAGDNLLRNRKEIETPASTCPVCRQPLLICAVSSEKKESKLRTLWPEAALR